MSLHTEIFQQTMILKELLDSQEKPVTEMARKIEDRNLRSRPSICLVPSTACQWLSPPVRIAPAQPFSYHLTKTMGYDTESPRTWWRS